MDFVKSLLISIFQDQVEDLNRFAADKTHKVLVLSFIKQISAFLFSFSLLGIALSLSLFYGPQSIELGTLKGVVWTLAPILVITALLIRMVTSRSRIEEIFESKKIRQQSAVNVLEIVEAIRQVKETFSPQHQPQNHVDKKFHDIDKTLVSVADAITALNTKIENQEKSNSFSSFQ